MDEYYNKKTLDNTLRLGKFKKIEKTDSYYVNRDGDVIRIKYHKNKGYKIIDVVKYITKEGHIKINLNDKCTSTSVLLHKVVYETFKGQVNYHEIYFKDNNKQNCSILNLITINELIDFYREKNNIKIIEQ